MRSSQKVNAAKCEAVDIVVPNRRSTSSISTMTTTWTAVTANVNSTPRNYVISCADDENQRQGLHKVLKIKYKDGTVALKSVRIFLLNFHLLILVESDCGWSRSRWQAYSSVSLFEPSSFFSRRRLRATVTRNQGRGGGKRRGSALRYEPNLLNRDGTYIFYKS